MYAVFAGRRPNGRAVVAGVLCVLCGCVGRGAVAQTPTPSPSSASPLDSSMAQWSSYVQFAGNPSATGTVGLGSSNAKPWNPADSGLSGTAGILSPIPAASSGTSDSSPLRVDLSPMGGSLGDAFKAGWSFTSKYTLPIFTVLIALWVGLNMAKRYAQKWGG